MSAFSVGAMLWPQSQFAHWTEVAECLIEVSSAEGSALDLLTLSSSHFDDPKPFIEIASPGPGAHRLSPRKIKRAKGLGRQPGRPLV
jgi:hypothetical protein